MARVVRKFCVADMVAALSASDIGLVTMVRKLLKMGTDVCAKTDDGKRALDRTAFKGHHEVVRLPLEHKIEVDEENGNEQMA